MAEIDPSTVPDFILMSRIWTILASYPPFADKIKPGNRLDQTLKKGYGVNYMPDSKPVKQAADMVEVDIDLGRATMRPEMVTFGGCTRDENHTQIFLVTITSDDESILDTVITKAAILRALGAQGATLGIPRSQLLVQNWSIPTSTNAKPAPGLGQPAGRRQMTLQLQVSYRTKYAL